MRWHTFVQNHPDHSCCFIGNSDNGLMFAAAFGNVSCPDTQSICLSFGPVKNGSRPMD